jgi:5,6,7,8-tetrahydromethanopterin hydro-lyase
MSVLPAMALGESFIGEGAEAAHINTILGPRNGPVGTAMLTAICTSADGLPRVSAVLAARDLPGNPCYTAPAPRDSGLGPKSP